MALPILVVFRNGLYFKSHSSTVMSLQTPSVVDVMVVGGVIVVGGVLVVGGVIAVVDMVDIVGEFWKQR